MTLPRFDDLILCLHGLSECIRRGGLLLELGCVSSCRAVIYWVGALGRCPQTCGEPCCMNVCVCAHVRASTCTYVCACMFAYIAFVGLCIGAYFYTLDVTLDWDFRFYFKQPYLCLFECVCVCVLVQMCVDICVYIYACLRGMCVYVCLHVGASVCVFRTGFSI